jgi:hypothetical protein
MITERYRSDYLGEFIILESRWSGGKKTQSREWVENPIENHHISGRACCIADSIDQHKFDHTRLQRHRGGLLGSKKLQTYGTGQISQQMRLDFAVETNPDALKEILSRGYQQENIVYTTARNVIFHPGEFYLIPFTPRLSNWAMLPYLAAFDGHKEVFLIGYHKEAELPNSATIHEIHSVISTYSSVKFYMVGESHCHHQTLLDNANVVPMDYRDFISYCDV